MKKQLFYCLAGLAALAACESDDQAGAGQTRVSVKMTDAPGIYDAIHLNVDEVQVLTENGRAAITVADNRPFDILKFSMGKDTLLATDMVASGRLQEVRLILDDEGNTITVDGQEYPLTTPSGQSSGVKIKVQDELIPNVAYTMLLDFDAAASITTTGNGKYMLKPVIRAIPEAVSGVIRGQVLPLEAAAHIYVEIDGERVGAVTDATGAFYFPGIADGTYSVVIEAGNSLFAGERIEDVVVENGVATNLETITLLPL